MDFKIIEEHKNNNPSPLIIRKGTRVKVGRISDSNDIWPNWVYCYDLNGNTEGWAPEQIIQIESNSGIVLEDYSAKELGVQKGEQVKGTIELNGWVWCSRISDSEEGWLPKEKMITSPF